MLTIINLNRVPEMGIMFLPVVQIICPVTLKRHIEVVQHFLTQGKLRELYIIHVFITIFY